MKRIVKVQILGQNFTLSSESDEAYIRKIADYVEKKVQEILDYSKAIASFNAAILAALNIADDYHHLKENQETLAGKILELSERVSATLGENLSPESTRGPLLGKLPVEGVQETSIEEEKTEV
jgi:cell division protein ZapA